MRVVLTGADQVCTNGQLLYIVKYQVGQDLAYYRLHS